VIAQSSPVISRLVASVILLAFVSAGSPAVADRAPVPPAPPPQPTGAHRRAGGVVLIVAAVFAVASTYLLVRARGERNDLNPDGGIADTAYGTLLGLSALATLTVAVVLWLPNEPRANQVSHPQMVLAPPGAALRFTF
jgi:hypothetical protein